MRLKIVDVNFSKPNNWLYHLCNTQNVDYYIMNENFYMENNLTTPITKRELDYLDIGYWITADTKEVDGKNIVTSILKM